MAWHGMAFAGYTGNGTAPPSGRTVAPIRILFAAFLSLGLPQQLDIVAMPLCARGSFMRCSLIGVAALCVPCVAGCMFVSVVRCTTLATVAWPDCVGFSAKQSGTQRSTLCPKEHRVIERVHELQEARPSAYA